MFFFWRAVFDKWQDAIRILSMANDGKDRDAFRFFWFPWHFFDLFISVYMLHETSQCFMTHSRDFCYVSKERVEVSFKLMDCLQFLYFLIKSRSTSITYYMARLVWAGKMNQILRCDWLPEQGRWSCLARSGLPAVSCKEHLTKIHIINSLLTKFVRSI